MPAKYFNCKNNNGDKIEISECLKYCKNRCLSLPTLMAIGEQREKTLYKCECGFKLTNTQDCSNKICPTCNKEMPLSYKASTTELLNGTRLSYLSITEEYTIDPFDSAFMLLGTRHHKILEDVAKKAGLISEKYLDAEITGILDLLVGNDNGNYSLWDYKTSGSYVVSRALGLKLIRGNGVPDTWEIDPAKVEMRDWELQLNHYRNLLQKVGFVVDDIYVQATVRDGGTKSAFYNGLEKNLYKIPVKILETDYVEDYFKTKSEALLKALDTETLPDKCNRIENWDLRRCKKYCNVAEFCDVGRHQRGK